MKIFSALLTTLFSLLSAFGTAHGADGFRTGGLVLYQRNDVLMARGSEEEIVEYMGGIERACHEYFMKEAKPKPPFAVVMAVKPGWVSRAWLVTSDATEAARMEPLKKKLESVPAMSVTEGPVVMAFLDEETSKSKDARGKGPPMPAEWREAVKNSKVDLQVPDGILAVVWPDTDEQKAAAKVPRVEYVEQILKPLGGKITKPKDWHYTEGHAGGKFVWTISEQDISGGGSYDTGVRIQAFFGVKQNTGKTAKEFLMGFLEAKQTGGAKVLSMCPEVWQGMFTRACVEVEEGRFRILYSVFWAEDFGVVMTSGAPKEQWNRYGSTFNRMTRFQLFDLEMLEKDAAKEDEAAKEKK